MYIHKFSVNNDDFCLSITIYLLRRVIKKKRREGVLGTCVLWLYPRVIYGIIKFDLSFSKVPTFELTIPLTVDSLMFSPLVVFITVWFFFFSTFVPSHLLYRCPDFKTILKFHFNWRQRSIYSQFFFFLESLNTCMGLIATAVNSFTLKWNIKC